MEQNSQSTQEQTQKPKLRVLLVEDDHTIAHALIIRLQAEGFEVLPAPDGASAVQVTRHISPDVLLLDINLPVKDGFQVAEEVRAALGDLPVVFITASNDARFREQAATMQPSWFVEKPFTTPFLVHRIHEAAAASA